MTNLDSFLFGTEPTPGAQKATLKKTDARVQTVTESEFPVPGDIDVRYLTGRISDECTPDDQVRVSCRCVATLTCVSGCSDGKRR
jgi:hypothetical protein